MRQRLLSSIALAGLAAIIGSAGSAFAQTNPQQVPTSLPPPPSERSKDDPLFSAARNNAFPMSPEQIDNFHNTMDESQRAATGFPRDKKISTRSKPVRVSLEPGGPPVEITLAPTFPTAIVIMDYTGQPWPIEAIANGNPRQIQAEIVIDGGNNISLTPLHPYPSGAMNIYLKGEQAPITLRINSALEGKGKQGEVDARRDIIVEAKGPNAVPDLIGGPNAPKAGGSLMLSILEGVPPPGARSIDVEGDPTGRTRAWRVGREIYLRTSMTVLSPAYTGRQPGTGVAVYQMQDTPVVLANGPDGRLMSLILR